MTDADGLRVALNSASFGDPEKEARLLLALARAPGDSLAGAYANGCLHAEGPALIAGLVARLDELREQPAAASTTPTAHHLSADDLDALPRGAVVRDADGRYYLKTHGGWEYTDWGTYSQDSLLMADDRPHLAGHIDLSQEDA